MNVRESYSRALEQRTLYGRRVRSPAYSMLFSTGPFDVGCSPSVRLGGPDELYEGGGSFSYYVHARTPPRRRLQGVRISGGSFPLNKEL